MQSLASIGAIVAEIRVGPKGKIILCMSCGSLQHSSLLVWCHLIYLSYEGGIFFWYVLLDTPQPLQSLHLSLALLPLLGVAQHPAHQHHRYLEQNTHPCTEEKRR